MKMQLNKREFRLLGSVFNLNTPTIKQIAEDNNLNPAVVISIMNKLEKRKIVIKSDRIITGPGRPTLVYNFSHYFGCSIGVTLTKSSLILSKISFSKDLIENKEVKTDPPIDPKINIIDIVKKIVFELKRFMSADSNFSNYCVGVSVPGMVDMAKGTWIFGHQIQGVENLKLREMIKCDLNAHIVVEDHARAITLFQKINGHGSSYRNFVVIDVNWGVGAGIVINNILYRGQKGIAGEIGHLILERNGRQCTCGSTGCLETILSEESIIREIREKLEKGVVSILNTKIKYTNLSLNEILEAAKKNDKLVRTVLFDVGSYLGQACTILLKLFNPEAIIITGSIALLADYLKEPVDITLRHDVMQLYLSECNIIFADYKPEHEAIGAALLAAQNYLSSD